VLPHLEGWRKLKEQLQTLFDYNRYVNAIILSQAEFLTEGQLNAVAKNINRSLFDLLFHMMRTECVWRTIAQTGRPPEQSLEIESFSKLSTIRGFWEEEEKIMQDYLLSVTEAELEENVELSRPSGVKNNFPRWGMLMHLLMHSMQHRSEAAGILTGYGQSPGDLDLIFYLAVPGNT
jgi:uncharacterized damage-inducible protein DinB